MNDILFVFLVQLALILIISRFGSFLAIRSGYSPILGQLFAGLLLGPTFLGTFFPELYDTIFPGFGTINYEILQAMSWLGLILLMFIGGMDVNVEGLRQNVRKAISISAITPGNYNGWRA